MEEYNVLNSIILGQSKNKFPYSLVTKEKIKLASKKITILAKEMEETAATAARVNAKTGSAEIPNKVIFYG